MSLESAAETNIKEEPAVEFYCDDHVENDLDHLYESSDGDDSNERPAGGNAFKVEEPDQEGLYPSERTNDLVLSISSDAESDVEIVPPKDEYAATVLKWQFQCVYCTTMFKELSGLNTHLRSPSSKTKRCLQCDREFSTNSCLKYHLKTAHKDLDCSCPTCHKNFGHRTELLQHKGEEHSVFECIFCTNFFDNETDLKLHMVEHTIKPKCQLCNLGLPTASQIIKRHQQRSGTAQLTCDLCDRKFLAFQSLTNHIFRYHDPKLQFQCTGCTMRFKTIDLLKRHIKFSIDCSRKADQATTSFRWMAIEWDQHKCFEARSPKPGGQCGESFSKTQSLNDHMKQMHDELPFSCTNCTYRFLTNELLFSHISTNVCQSIQKKPTRFSCDQCNRKYSDEKYLFKHVKKSHDTSLPFKCPKCTFRFRTSSLLSAHLRKNICSTAHTNPPDCYCLQCGQTFGETKQMQAHVNQAHDPSLPLTCPHCTCRFRTAKSLGNHLRGKDCHILNQLVSNPDPVVMDLTASSPEPDPESPLNDIVENIDESPSPETETATDDKGLNIDDNSIFIDFVEYEKETAMPNGVFTDLSNASHDNSNISTGDLDTSVALQNNRPDESDGASNGLQVFECKYCSHQFETCDDLNQHVDYNLPDKTSCEKCHQEFPSYKCLQYHKQTIHDAVTIFACLICEMKFVTCNNLAQHRLAIHSLYDCMQCVESFQNENDFKTHQTEHTNYPKCEKCLAGLPNLHQIGYRHKKNRTELFQTTCDICDLSFANRKLLHGHLWRYHDPDLLFQCTACSFRFATANILTKHIASTPFCNANANKTPSKLRWSPREWNHHFCNTHILFKCTHVSCSRSFSNWQDLETHRTTHYTVMCNYCSRYFPDSTALKWHNHLSHNPDYPLKCANCTLRFKTDNVLKVHAKMFCKGRNVETEGNVSNDIADKNGQDQGTLDQLDIDDIPEKCKCCHKMMHSEKAMKSHVNTLWHGKKRCQRCNRVFLNQHCFAHHMNSHIQNYFTMPGFDKPFSKWFELHKAMGKLKMAFECLPCSQFFDAENDLKDHKLGHSMSPQCKLCRKGLDSVRDIFLRHTERSGILQTTCDLCDRVFANVPSLYKHINTYHDPDLKLQCTACTMRFQTESALKRHFQFNMDCNISTDKRVSVPHWLMQEWEHHKCQTQSIFVCYQCNVSFNSSDEIQTHRETHVGNSLCDLCGRMCSDKAALNIHIIRQHDPNQPVKCPNCSCRFQSKNLLSKHLKFECIEKTLPKPTPPKSLMIQKSQASHVQIASSATQPVTAGKPASAYTFNFVVNGESEPVRNNVPVTIDIIDLDPDTDYDDDETGGEIETDCIPIKKNHGQKKYVAQSKSHKTVWLSTPSAGRKTSTWTWHRTRMNQHSRSTVTYTKKRDALKRFLCGRIVHCMVIETNRKAKRMFDKYQRLPSAKPMKPWQATNEDEMYAFIAILIYAGAEKANLCATKELFHISHMPFYRAVMSQQRFEELLTFLRFDDSTTREVRSRGDMLTTFRHVWQIFQSNLNLPLFVPSKELRIDEQFIACSKKFVYGQPIPTRPDKYGIKIVWLIDQKSNYPLIGEITFPNEDWPNVVSQRLVLRLANRFTDAGANITMGNSFTSIPLAKSLFTQKTTMVGAIRSNQPEIPEIFSSDVEATRRGPHASVFGFSNEISLVSYTTAKKDNVLLISTAHATDACAILTNTPIVVHDYNQNTAEDSSLETTLSTFSCARPSNSWPMLLFYNIINIAGLAAFRLVKPISPVFSKKIDLKKRKSFLKKVAFELAEPHLANRCQKPLPRSVRNAMMSIGFKANNHHPEALTKLKKRRRFEACDESCKEDNKRKSIECDLCSRSACGRHYALACNNCFKVKIEDPDVVIVEEDNVKPSTSGVATTSTTEARSKRARIAQKYE